MSLLHEASPQSAPEAVEYGIVSWWGVAVGAAGLAELQRVPGPACVALPSASLLKHADAQSVLALSAVLHAIAESGGEVPGPGGFSDWAVVAAPRFLGRAAFAAAFARYQAEGAWGVSPHIVPHRSLHSPAGLLSLVLHAQGPNFGVGGGPNNVAEAFLAAAALASLVSGLWLVFTGWDHEPLWGSEMASGMSGSASSLCRAAALALVPRTEKFAGPRLRICHAPLADPLPASSAANVPALTLAGLSEMLGSRQPLMTAAWSLGPATRVELLAAPGQGGLSPPVDAFTTTAWENAA